MNSTKIKLIQRKNENLEEGLFVSALASRVFFGFVFVRLFILIDFLLLLDFLPLCDLNIVLILL